MSTSRVDPGAATRRALRGLSAVGLAAWALLAGCAAQGGSGAAPRSPPAAATHDWRSATYTMTCDGLAPEGFSVTLADGAARVPADVSQTPYYDYFDIRFEAEASGDIDRDGIPDAVVLLQCFPQPSNGFREEAQVFSAARGRLGVLPSPATLPEAAELAPLYDPTGLTVENGDILAAMKVYGPGDSHASGPSEHVTVRWHWDGQRFIRVA